MIVGDHSGGQSVSMPVMTFAFDALQGICLLAPYADAMFNIDPLVREACGLDWRRLAGREDWRALVMTFLR